MTQVLQLQQRNNVQKTTQMNSALFLYLTISTFLQSASAFPAWADLTNRFQIPRSGIEPQFIEAEKPAVEKIGSIDVDSDYYDDGSAFIDKSIFQGPDLRSIGVSDPTSDPDCPSKLWNSNGDCLETQTLAPTTSTIRPKKNWKTIRKRNWTF